MEPAQRPRQARSAQSCLNRSVTGRRGSPDGYYDKPYSSGSVVNNRIAVAPAGIRRVRCLGGDGDDTSAAPMSGHHHSQRLILAHVEFRLKNYDDELVGREVTLTG